MSTRRSFLTQSAVVAASAAAAAMSPGVRAQMPPSPYPLDLSTISVSQITMVVRDVQKVAQGFVDVFGPSWTFYEFKPLPNPCVLKLAVGICGGYVFKLVQPVSGKSAYADFLERHGEGFYSIGVGSLRNFDGALEALKKAGVGIEIQGQVGDGSQFAVLQTAPDLGCRIEIMSGVTQETAANLRKTGTLAPKKPSIFDMGVPAFQGGRRFTQIGLVVKDAQAVSQRYEALLGIKGWRFIPIPVTDAALRGVALTETELPSATVTQGVAYMGGTQIELLAPVEQGPGGIHRKFFDKHGADNGFQHLMISPATGGREATLKVLDARGFKREWTATVHIGKMVGHGDYVDLEDRLGGFVLEYNG